MKLTLVFILILSFSAFAQNKASEVGSETLRRAKYTIDGFKALGYEKYDKLDLNNTEYRPIHLIPLNQAANNASTQAFLRALEDEKENLMKIYGLKNYQYNEMAKLAVGILGNESRFFKSAKYKIKETLPALVRVAKALKSMELNYPCPYCDELTMTGDTGSPIHKYRDFEGVLAQSPISISPGYSSRGGTQIKRVPDAIKEHYGIEENELKDPRNAAIATMGFLAQSAQELRWKQLDCVNDDNFYELVLYIYNGRHSELNNCTATPNLNGYVVGNRRNRAMFQIWEEP